MYNMKEKQIKVLKVEPFKAPEVVTIENTLESLQAAVDGLIQITYPWRDNACIICNDEGKYLGMELNRALYEGEEPCQKESESNKRGEIYDIIAGTFLITGISDRDGYQHSLTEKQIQAYTERFKYPERFLKYLKNGTPAIIAMPVK